jgi:phenylalanine ammonia-lyase
MSHETADALPLPVMTSRTPAALKPVELHGADLTLGDLERAVDGATVVLRPPDAARARFERSRYVVCRHVAEGHTIYGVNTAFGGMSNRTVVAEQSALLQRNALLHNRAGAGPELPDRCVRAGMLLRVNSHLRGVSGLRWELVERIVAFLNAPAVPLVREWGSIGASGDLVPLSAIARCVTGIDPHAGVRYHGDVHPAAAVLEALGLKPMELESKEGLAMVNGTSVSTGIAACCVLDAARLVTVTLGFHALVVQALQGSTEPFDAFIHENKPHPGQVWVAEAMRRWLDGGQLTDPSASRAVDQLVQDRYSIRCLPQFLGPVVDTVMRVGGEIEVEMNSATDNPLVDTDLSRIVHGGNFLAQYPATGLDALRAQLALAVKHVDAQLALAFAPEFSNGLPASLVGNSAQPTNMGLKALQTAGNSIMPLVVYLAAPLASGFPTHAEQFNQNINSQSFGAAYLARQQIQLASHHLAIALLCVLQAVELRAATVIGNHDPREVLSEATIPFYETLCGLLQRAPSRTRPYSFDDGDRNFEVDIDVLAHDLQSGHELAGVAERIGLAVPPAYATLGEMRHESV